MAETWNKKERLKKKQQQKKEKAEKKLERKENARNGNNLESMMAYLDENGNLVSEPPDPKKKIDIKAEDIEVSVPKYIHDPKEAERRGTVTFFNTAKGYGFIVDKANNQKVFVHANALTSSIKENDKVIFEIEMGPKGASAVNVRMEK